MPYGTASALLAAAVLLVQAAFLVMIWRHTED
jgi:hypothetical protein